MTKVGYIFKQKYSFDDTEKHVHREGFTVYAVTHTVDETGTILRSYITKCAPDAQISEGDTGNPMFDSFKRLVTLL